MQELKQVRLFLQYNFEVVRPRVQVFINGRGCLASCVENKSEQQSEQKAAAGFVSNSLSLTQESRSINPSHRS